jgi:hypothetical protein
MVKDKSSTNRLLSDLTDYNENIYDMTKELAGIAKQIKEDTKEDAEPPKPVLEAILRRHENSVG